MVEIMKIGSVSKNLDQDMMRKKRLEEIFMKSAKTQDDAIFIEHYLKHYFTPTAVNEIRGFLEQNHFFNLLIKSSMSNFKAGEYIFTKEPIKNTNIYLITAGKVTLLGSRTKDDPEDTVEIVNKHDSVFVKDFLRYRTEKNFSLFSLRAEEACQLIVVPRAEFESSRLSIDSVKITQRLKCIEKNITKIKKSDNKESFLHYFKDQTLNYGHILTTPIAGSSDLYLVSKGKVLIFIPNKINTEYQSPVMVIAVVGAENCFNETSSLFEKDPFYGTMIVEDNTELLHIDKKSLELVTDQSSIDNLRANYQGKERIFKTFMEKFNKLGPVEVRKEQENLCSTFGVDLNKVLEYIGKQTKDGRINITVSEEQQKKNLEMFNQKFKKIDLDEAPKNLLGTNRIVSRDPNFKGLNPTQQLALLALQKEAKGRREGNAEPAVGSGVSMFQKVDRTDVLTMKNKLLQEDRGEILRKKGIGEKKLENQVPVNPNAAGSFLSKMRQSNEELMENLRMKEDMEKQKREKEEKMQKGGFEEPVVDDISLEISKLAKTQDKYQAPDTNIDSKRKKLLSLN